MRPDELHVRPVVATGVAIALAIAVVIGTVLLLLSHWHLAPQADRVPAHEPAPVPPPLLQSAPQQDLAAYRAEKERELHALAWVDRSRGLARIPIDDAMALLLRGAGAPP